MSDPSTPAADPREVATSRLLPYPAEAVFSAFADPQRLARWWGPEGFTNTIQEFDFRPGGRWRVVMHAPNGADFANESEFVELDSPRRIVFRHLEPVHAFVMTLTLRPEAGGTRLGWSMCFDQAEEAARVRPFVVVANEQNLDRLEQELARPG